MMRLLLVLVMVVSATGSARADTLDLHKLYGRASAFIGSLIGEQPHDGIIAPPVSIDRGMIIAPPASGTLRNILPEGDRPVRPD